MTKRKLLRKPGFYWVEDSGMSPEIARWDGKQWLFVGCGADPVHGEIRVVSELLVPPGA